MLCICTMICLSPLTLLAGFPEAPSLNLVGKEKTEFEEFCLEAKVRYDEKVHELDKQKYSLPWRSMFFSLLGGVVAYGCYQLYLLYKGIGVHVTVNMKVNKWDLVKSLYE